MTQAPSVPVGLFSVLANGSRAAANSACVRLLATTRAMSQHPVGLGPGISEALFEVYLRAIHGQTKFLEKDLSLAGPRRARGYQTHHPVPQTAASTR